MLRESQRSLLATELMGVLGQLIFIHRSNLAEVEEYFDLSLLRDVNNELTETLEGQMNGLGTVTVSTATPIDRPDVQLTLSNESAEEIVLEMGFVATADIRPASMKIVVRGGEERIVTAGGIGFSSGNRFLTIYNSSSETASYGLVVEF